MASDRIVTARHVLQSAMEVERRGLDDVVKGLEALEPDLTDYLLEQSCQIHHRLLRLGISGRPAQRIYRRAETLTVVCVLALRRAQADLWDKVLAPTPNPPTPRRPPTAS